MWRSGTIFEVVPLKHMHDVPALQRGDEIAQILTVLAPVTQALGKNFMPVFMLSTT